MKHARLLPVLLGLLLLGASAAPAQTEYTIRSIFKVGDVAADFAIHDGLSLFPAGLADDGRIIFAAYKPDGTEGDRWFQWKNGTTTLIAQPGSESPDGIWPETFWSQAWGTNHLGGSVFNALEFAKNTVIGIYAWDPVSGKFRTLAKKGMVTADGLTVEDPAGINPAINDAGDIVVPIGVSEGGVRKGPGIFLLDRNGKWQTIIRSLAELPGGGKVNANYPYLTAINDAGVVTLGLRKVGSGLYGLYNWEAGTLTAILPARTEVPGVGLVTSISSFTNNDVNRDLMVTLGVGGSRNHGVYRITEGKVIPVALPGQEMPGGGKFRTVRYVFDAGGPQLANGLGTANEQGQRALLATLEDGTSALYRVDLDGALALVLKQGQQTPLGTITHLGQKANLMNQQALPWLNSRGEIAIVLELDNGPQTLALLVPKTP